MTKFCGQVNIPTVNNSAIPCTQYFDSDCIIYQSPISYFGTTESSNATEVFNFIIASLIDARSRVIVLEDSLTPTDHGALTGLSDDDHLQYLTDVRGRSLLLTGLNVGLTGDVTATDTVLSAFGKIQYQLDNVSSGLSGIVTLDFPQTITGVKTFQNQQLFQTSILMEQRADTLPSVIGWEDPTPTDWFTVVDNSRSILWMNNGKLSWKHAGQTANRGAAFAQTNTDIRTYFLPDESGTVSLDANVVHKGLTETITGDKTFTTVDRTRFSNNDFAQITFNNTSLGSAFDIGVGSNASLFAGTGVGFDLRVNANLTSALYIDINELVKLGTISATEKLNIAGYVKATGYKTPTGTSDDILLANGATTSLSAATGGTGHAIKDEGTTRTTRANLNFIGTAVTATDNAGTNSTDVTVAAVDLSNAQTGIAGAKTWTGLQTYQATSIFEGIIALPPRVKAGYAPGGAFMYLGSDQYFLSKDTEGRGAILDFSLISAGAIDRTYTFPNQNGTIALLSDIAGGSAHIIQEEGASLTARANLNFIGTAVSVSDNAGASATDVTIDAVDLSTNQIIDGFKTFNNSLTAAANSVIGGNLYVGRLSVTDSTTTAAGDHVILMGEGSILASPSSENRMYFDASSRFGLQKQGDANIAMLFDHANTAARIYTFPDQAGTVALLSDITGGFEVFGSTSGSITLEATAIAGTNTLTLPAETAILATQDYIAGLIDFAIQAYDPALDAVTGVNTGNETTASIKALLQTTNGLNSTEILDDAITEPKLAINNAGTDEAYLSFVAAGPTMTWTPFDLIKIHPNSDSIVRYITVETQAAIDSAGYDDTVLAFPSDAKSYEYVQIMCSDFTTAVTTGTLKGFAVAPVSGTVSEVWVDLITAGTTTGITVDINKNGTTILSTKLSTDATESSSSTASTPAVISVPSITKRDKITIDFDGVPTGAAGVLVTVVIEKA